jgi:hypothetical protein
MPCLSWSLACASLGLLGSLALAGCTTGNSTGAPDAGEGDSGIEPDGSVGTVDSGSQLPVGDGGPCIVATSVPASEIPAYATVVAQPNACSATQISDFVTSCTGSTATPAACNSFQTSAANGACLDCLFPATEAGATFNTGGVLLDSTGTSIVGVNLPGCIALADPTNGPACAAGLEPLFQCESQACGSADCRTSTTSVYEMCLTSTETAACSSQYAASSPCAGEYEDGGAAVGACGSDTQVLNVICGAGM